MSGPVRLGTRWRRSRARTSLQRQVSELADRASPPGVTVWRVPPVVEVCTAIDYPAWRNARERAWERDGNRYSGPHLHLARADPGRRTGGGAADPVPRRPLARAAGRDRRADVLARRSGPRARHRAPLRAARARPADRLDEARARRSAPSRAAGTAAHRRDRPGAQASLPRDLGITWPLEPSEPHIPPRRH